MAPAAPPGEPDESNGFCAVHAALLCDSYHRWLGRDLVAADGDRAQRARRLFEAPFAVLSHGTGRDPLFTYANRTALALFEATWAEMTLLPSRLSAEPENQAERARLLARVASHGCIDDYAGIRISRTGRRFAIRRAVVWTLVDTAGAVQGQAATFAHWEPTQTPSTQM